MGKYDDAMYSFLSDNGRFADLFNGAVLGQTADAARKQKGQTKQPGGQALKAQNRYRDIKKHLKEGAGFSVVAI